MEKIKIYKIAFMALVDKHARTSEKLDKDPNNTKLKNVLEEIDEELEYLHSEIVNMQNNSTK